MTFETWLAFAATSTLLVLIPGPTVLLVLSYALTQGRRVALAMTAGVALGDFIAMTASLAGLGALVLASATLFTILKWVGAAYLIYLGITLLRSANSAPLGEHTPTGSITPGKVALHATTVTALNPKSIAFFIAFVPQFITPDTALIPQFSILIATFVGIAGTNALIYALLADKMRVRLQNPNVLKWITKTGGMALITMGLTTALLKRT
jgi:threonine/homoserine/homoserine lactone efflux protein